MLSFFFYKNIAIQSDLYVIKQVPLEKKFVSMFSDLSSATKFKDALANAGLNEKQIFSFKEKYPEINALTQIYEASTSSGSSEAYHRAIKDKKKMVALFQKDNVCT